MSIYVKGNQVKNTIILQTAEDYPTVLQTRIKLAYPEQDKSIEPYVVGKIKELNLY